MPARQHQQYGAPRSLWLNVAVEADGTVSLDLQAFNKAATRLGEASCCRFRPAQVRPYDYCQQSLSLILLNSYTESHVFNSYSPTLRPIS